MLADQSWKHTGTLVRSSYLGDAGMTGPVLLWLSDGKSRLRSDKCEMYKIILPESHLHSQPLTDESKKKRKKEPCSQTLQVTLQGERMGSHFLRFVLKLP